MKQQQIQKHRATITEAEKYEVWQQEQRQADIEREWDILETIYQEELKMNGRRKSERQKHTYIIDGIPIYDERYNNTYRPENRWSVRI